MSAVTPNETTETAPAVVYNEFAGKLVEGLEVIGFTFKESDGRIEVWTSDKGTNHIEVSVDYIKGSAAVEVTNRHRPTAPKRQTVYMKSNDDLYRVVKFAQ